MDAAILGSGSWATALVKILTGNGHPVNWWIRNAESIQHIRQRGHNPHYLSSADLDVNLLDMSDDINRVISKSGTLIMAVPSSYVVDVLKSKRT